MKNPRVFSLLPSPEQQEWLAREQEETEQVYVYVPRYVGAISLSIEGTRTVGGGIVAIAITIAIATAIAIAIAGA